MLVYKVARETVAVRMDLCAWRWSTTGLLRASLGNNQPLLCRGLEV